MKKPPFPTENDLIQAWIDMTVHGKGTPEYEESFWAFMALQDLIEEYPNVALSVIREILRKNQTNKVFECLSAGPLEDLLGAHGPMIIEKVEEAARSDPVFRKLLGGVWQNQILEDIWQRVQAVWDRRGWDGIPE
jgi:hypothetical protein